MPRYDYQCNACRHRFEVKQSFDSEPVATCPKCENTASRQFSAVPIMFRGSGWYVNDYGKRSSSISSSSSDSSGSGDSAGTASSNNSSESSGSKSESKTSTSKSKDE